MSFVPSSQYKNFPTYDFNGRPFSDASFRNAFIQSQAPMLLESAGGDGDGDVTVITTAFPLTGDGTITTPVTFAAANTPCRTVFWNGTTWNHNVPSGIVEVTIGNNIAGANFQTIQEAFDLGCHFVRVITSITEPSPLVLPFNAIIYVDPGITLTLANGQMDVTGRSLTLLGNGSSSTIIFGGNLLTDVGSRIYFRDCRCMNASGGPLTDTNTLNFGFFSAFGTTFVTSNTQYCLFGTASINTMSLDLVDCTIEGSGTTASEFLTNVTSTTILQINGLTVSGDWSLGAVLARTNLVGPWQLNNISVNTNSGSNAANPFVWAMGGGGIMQQMKQFGANFVQLNMNGDNTQVNNLHIHRLVINGVFQGMKISNVECSGDFNINGPIGLQITNLRAVSDAVFPVCVVTNLQNCDINNLRVSGDFECSSDDTNYSNCHISGLLNGANFANQRCTFRGVYAQVLICQGIHNSFIGGTYTDINPSGVGLGSNFAFSGVRCSNIMRLNNVFHVVDSCFIENMDIGASDFCSVSNSVIRNALSCGNGAIISNCKVDTGGGGNDILVSGVSNVQISNCTVGRSNPFSAASTVSGIVLPGPGVTLIINCKTRTPIAPSVNVINCVTF